ncbi:response regulator receiver domain [Vibrio owensii]|uniref:response regulator receiver domain n=1 Tax=Vibrio owensii TaxID=696485 RepID=UPI00339403A0
MTTAYNSIIEKTFCENSIRSVTLIDDEVMSYNQIVSGILNQNEKIKEGNATEFNLMQSLNAASITKFFQSKKIICDIESDPSNIDHEKIRKSDLVILDYQLDGQSALLSKELVYKLSCTPHMNMVVIYTSKDLKDVWYELATYLRGRNTEHAFSSTEVESLWEDICDDEELPNAWVSLVSDADVVEILYNNSLTSETKREICALLVGPHKRHMNELVSLFIDKFIEDKYAVCSEYIDRNLQGDNGDVKWLQVGNVFVTLFKKGESEAEAAEEGESLSTSEAEAIWKRLISALQSWKPNYFRIVLSEIQNILEDKNLCMDKFLIKGNYEQAAILWNILDYKNQDKIAESIENLLKNIHEDIQNEAIANKDLHDFIEHVSLSISEEYPEFVKPEIDPLSRSLTNQQQVDEYHHALMSICLGNVNSTIGGSMDLDERKRLVHAFNKDLSSTNSYYEYITTGTILWDKDDNEWYLCVSPSCNTVAGQNTDELAKRMSPHRTLRFIKLSKCSLSDALKNATHGRYLFVNKNDEPIALLVQNEVTGLPRIEYGIVHEHDNRDLKTAEYKTVSFFKKPTPEKNIDFSESKLFAVAQLRPAYAARFQNLQSHYEGRIGVDYLPVNITYDN